jgi:hypothetical protein
MALKKSKKKASLDLNGDGKFDEKDKSLAAKALATKIDKKADQLEEEPKEAKKEEALPKEGKVALVDINQKYRKGDLVPKEQIELWQEMGLELDRWF